jgi:hypothetical protein
MLPHTRDAVTLLGLDVAPICQAFALVDIDADRRRPALIGGARLTIATVCIMAGALRGTRRPVACGHGSPFGGAGASPEPRRSLPGACRAIERRIPALEVLLYPRADVLIA